MTHLLLTTVTLGMLVTAPAARADLSVHYAPAESLERLDVMIINGAKHDLDMAAFVLTDWPIIQALARAANRGVAVRIYLDGAQLAEYGRTNAFQDLVDTPGVEIRTKQDHGAAMHLKSYEVDGRLLRTGSANFTASGEQRQDNDLIVIDSVEAAAAFKREFDGIFVGGQKIQ
jgi:phosphatidylserine/phosphatidylglycerophosphate/cardiolipin synthase-like enzyme